MINPSALQLVLELANSKKPRRPSGERSARVIDPLENRESLIDFLRILNHPCIPGQDLALLTIDIEQIMLIREALDQILSNIVEHKRIPADSLITLNDCARDCCWARELRPDGTGAEIIKTGNLAGMLASICILELSQCDITRIKVCEQAPCSLYFYDTTRNRSARWHAENPCGWRARSTRRK